MADAGHQPTEHHRKNLALTLPSGLHARLLGDLVIGTLSGGCVEEDLPQKLADNAIDASSPQLIEYGVSAEEMNDWACPVVAALKFWSSSSGPASMGMRQ